MAPIPNRWDYVMSLAQRSNVTMPLHSLKEWRPVKIDALGLVTLLGADDVDRKVGTLQQKQRVLAIS